MITKIATSQETERRIIELQSLLRLSTKAAIIRIAVGISLQIKDNEELQIDQYQLKHDGAQYNLATVMGEHVPIYESMVQVKSGRTLTDHEMTKLFNRYIEFGVDKLYAKYQYHGNYEKMMKYLLSEEFE